MTVFDGHGPDPSLGVSTTVGAGGAGEASARADRLSNKFRRSSVAKDASGTK